MDDLDLKKINAMLGLPTHSNETDDIDEDEDQLEDELNAILSGQSTARSNARNRKQSIDKQLQSLNYDHLLKDDPEDDDDDDDLIDENDPQLLAELNQFVGASPVKSKPLTSNTASSKATVSHQTTAATTRAQPSISQPISSPADQSSCVLLQNSHFRANASESNKQFSSSNQSQAPSIDSKLEQLNLNAQANVLSLATLNEWRTDYRNKALTAKKENNVQLALECMRSIKTIETGIALLEKDPTADLSHLELKSPHDSQNAGDAPFADIETLPELTEEEAQKLFNAPPPPTSILEALEQRLAKYQQTMKEAQDEGNTSKVRRLTRIVKNYEAAIKACKQGKDYDYESLPAPPGFADIPLGKTNPLDQAKSQQSVNPTSTTKPAPVSQISNEANKSIPSTKTQAPPVPARPPPPANQPTKPPVVKELKRGTSTERKMTTTAEKQITYLLERQKQFKNAALEAKKEGDIEKAKEYLRNAKGFDPLIEATRSGLPIDVSSIPSLPDTDGDFVIVTAPKDEELGKQDQNDDDREEMYRKLEMDLLSQITVCNTNREYFLKVGNSSSALMFENYLVDMKKDLTVLRNNWKRGDQVPKFHYEQKVFSIVESNPDLPSNQILIEIVSGIDYPCKGEPDTFVKFEFPFPKDNPQMARTHTFKNSRNPQYKQSYHFEIDRKSRSLARSLKRGLRCEIIIKGGLFRSDQLLGSVNIPLNDLETKCQIFESFPLTTGRKAIGGQLQVRVKLREPLLSKQIKEIREKWLVLD